MGNGMDKSIISQCTRERARVINENIVASLHKTTNLNGKIDLSSVCVCSKSKLACAIFICCGVYFR